MVKLTRLNGSEFTLNAELIVFIEECPDTVISLTTGQKILVRESATEIKEKVICYKRQVVMINR